MALGPGKYDDICTLAREAAKATGCLIIIINGDRGHGFSIQMTPDLILTCNVPGMLRDMANAIEEAL